jgi:hypothetical protein
MKFLNWLIGGGVNALAGPLERAYKAKLDAQNDTERLEAEKQIRFYKEQIGLSQSASADPWWSPRVLMAYCVVAYVFKIVVWDTVLQMDVTPNPGQQVTGIVMLIVGFYYGSYAFTQAAGSIASSFARKR